MNPRTLGIKGSTQPEIFQGTVDAMAFLLLADAALFWRDALSRDGPIEVWVIQGERYLYNGNHRYHAAVRAGVEIPEGAVVLVDKAGSPIPSFLLKDLVWLPGFK